MKSEPQVAPLSDPPSLEGMDSEERVEAMVQWFFENFEDPAHETPYDGREGGYQYVWGGPYEASDYINDYFPDVPEEDHAAAVEEIDAEGPYWAPAGHRILPPEDDYDYTPTPPLEDRLLALSTQLETLSAQVSQMLALQQEQTKLAGIGHNNPPPDDDAPPSLEDVLESIEQVKAELRKPNPLDDANQAVLQVAESRFARFKNWFIKTVSEAPGRMVNGAITGAGGLLLGYALAHQSEIWSTASFVAQTVQDWAFHLSSPF